MNCVVKVTSGAGYNCREKHRVLCNALEKSKDACLLAADGNGNYFERNLDVTGRFLRD